MTSDQFSETVDGYREAHRHAFRGEQVGRMERQERMIQLAAEAHLETRSVERVLRARSWRLQPMGVVEFTVLSEHVDAAIAALSAIVEEAGRG